MTDDEFLAAFEAAAIPRKDWTHEAHVRMAWLYLRTHDPAYKALAKRWSKVALILFAVGVVTGTILSFEFGLLWPDFMATFGEVFGLAFGLEGISFFVEAIFIAIYTSCAASRS